MFACNKKKLVMNKRARDSLVTRFNGNIMPYMTRTCHRSLLFRIRTGLFKMFIQIVNFAYGFYLSILDTHKDFPEINPTCNEEEWKS